MASVAAATAHSTSRTAIGRRMSPGGGIAPAAPSVVPAWRPGKQHSPSLYAAPVARLAVTARLSDPGAVDRLRAAGHDVAVRDDPAPAAPDELRALAVGREGILCLPADRIDAGFLDATGVRWVSNHAVGTDNVDLAAAAERGVAVANTPGVLDDAVADLCVALALAAARRVAEGDRLVRSGGWTGFSTDLLLGHDLAGATAGLVGLGGVGRAVARRLVAGFGMRGLYAARARTRRTSGPSASSAPRSTTCSGRPTS